MLAFEGVIVPVAQKAKRPRMQMDGLVGVQPNPRERPTVAFGNPEKGEDTRVRVPPGTWGGVDSPHTIMRWPHG